MKHLPKVALVGMPNVGKSTLFNRLSHSNQAITSEQAHTTRDVNRAVVSWQSSRFELVDTAGYNRESDFIKASAMTQLTQELAGAESVIFLVDATAGLSQAEQGLAANLHKLGKPLVLAINKTDTRSMQPPQQFDKLGIKSVVNISAINGTGTGDLLDAVVGQLPKSSASQAKASLQVAVLGRPNVGKSSLINALAGEKLAIVSEQAHTTRDVNQFELTYHGTKLNFVDTAGLRRPGKRGRDIEYFSSVRTQKAIEIADACLVLIDASDIGARQDQAIAGLVKEAGKPLVLVVSKWDSVEDKDSSSMALASKIITREFQFVWWAPLVFTSAHDKQNLSKMIELVTQVHKNAQTKLATTKLNKLLQKIINQKPPTATKSTRPKLNYITQTGIEPPTFAIFGSHTNKIHFSYSRHIENRLREEFEFSGTPIRIEYRSKHKDKS